ncbi:MAG: glucose-6-phosphate dehydrogenase, partial [Gemmatimonadales bacterium]
MTGPVMVPARMAGPSAPNAGQLRPGSPCVVVIFGAAGDLAHRKLIPALFNLALDGASPDTFAILGIDREAKDDVTFRRAMRDAVMANASWAAQRLAAWERFEQRLYYMAGDFTDAGCYTALQGRLQTLDALVAESEGHLFHLAIPPSLYQTVITHLSESGVLPRIGSPDQRPWARVIIEKPFGHDLASARALNAVCRKAMAEHQVYRIDHYLGKEVVQDLMVLRFANLIFEPLWNRHHIDHVQITAAEQIGIEHRGRYYEEAGVVRDMFQNHLMQLLTLTAMEPPAAFRADAVRDEKVKVLHAIRPPTREEIDGVTVRGQYGPGVVDGVAVPGYREEENVAPDSTTPTYAAMRFSIDNWRWKGVPFFLRSGKRLPTQATEIAIQFRRPPHLMFPLPAGEQLAANVLAVRIQPREGMSLQFDVKVPGFEMRMASVRMVFDFAQGFGTAGHDAYETLLLDCILGDATLFTRSDEAESAWELLDPLLAHWQQSQPTHFPNYAAGTWGPTVANELIATAQAAWRTPGAPESGVP